METVQHRPAYSLWLAAAGVLTVGWVVVCATLNLMIDRPSPLGLWLPAGLLWLPLGLAIAAVTRGRRISARVFVECVAVAGLAVLIAVAYLVFVVGMDGKPKGHERDVLLSSLIAALVVAALSGGVAGAPASCSRRSAQAHMSSASAGPGCSAR